MNDWPARLRLVALQLHLSPEAFWRLSVKEWAALTAAPPTDALGRGDFDALMAAHPDRPSPSHNAVHRGPLPLPKEARGLSA